MKPQISNVPASKTPALLCQTASVRMEPVCVRKISIPALDHALKHQVSVTIGLRSGSLYVHVNLRTMYVHLYTCRLH